MTFMCMPENLSTILHEATAFAMFKDNVERAFQYCHVNRCITISLQIAPIKIEIEI